MAVLISLLCGNAGAEGYCESPQDALAVRTAALQQEMMVAAFICHDIAAYNRFVLSHQSELQETDKALMSFFLLQNSLTGGDDYNFYKTELANASSLRSVRDPQFCRRVNADFNIALGGYGSLAQLLPALPYPVETGSVRCKPDMYNTTAATNTVQHRRVRHRTWLGRLVDAISD